MTLIAPFPAMAAPGELDTFFDADGKLDARLDSSDDRAQAVAVDALGRTVVAGYGWNGTNLDFALARYNLDGSLDRSFGVKGKVLTPIGSFDDRARAIAIQSDGKIAVAGSSNLGAGNFIGDFALARYNTDGSLDMTFGGTGKITTKFTSLGNSGSQVHGLVIQRVNGVDKIVAAGGYGQRFAFARYNPNGSLDTTFSSDGKQYVAFDDDARSLGVAIEPLSNKIVAAGYTGNDSFAFPDADFALVRLNASGKLDSTFGPGGKVITDFNGYHDVANAVTIQSDGKIVLAGRAGTRYATSGHLSDFALARYTQQGTLDPTFGAAGRVTTRFESGTREFNAMAMQSVGP